MDTQLASMLGRADELLMELEDEYNNCLKAQNITERAKNLTHEVLEKLRSALDHTMVIAWNKYIAPNLSEQDKSRARVYFPTVGNLNALRSTLGRGCMANLDKVHKNLYDFVLKQQPFSSGENQWLDLLAQIAAEGKHVRLTPQKRKENYRIKVSRPEGGSVSWDPSSVRFGHGVSVMGAPIDPMTQRIVPTPGVTDQAETWVSFIFESYEINALGFCKDACQETRVLIKEMLSII
jgi:hypothetical protein